MAANKGLTLRQFVAVLHKNFILQTRGRRSVLGSGWGAVLLQILLPVAFFSLMCIPKYYIQPYEHPAFLQPQEYDVDTKWWAGASPYEGPALSAGNNARIVFVPDTPAVASLASRVAMAVSCPAEPYKRICSPASITTFACMFGVGQAPASCQNSTACMTTPACYQAALSSHLRLLPDEEAALQLLREQPGSVDAVVVFPEALAAAKAAKAAAAAAAAAGDGAGGTRVPSASKRSRRQMAAADHVGHGSSSSSSSSSAPSAAESGSLGCGTPGNADGDGLLLDYVIRMNGSDVPPTQLLQDLFDVSPGIMPLPGNLLWEYRRYWFFLNLQLAIDRALLGGQQSNASLPAGLTLKLKPFPWPAKQEDIGAASAAALLNLLLVYAFMAPTRAVVGSIVREKELRLREGMRILGLSEAAYWASWSLTHWLTLAASGLLCALVGAYPFRHSSLALMTAFYWLFSAALISFSYFLSTLFTASRVAGTATQFVYALSMIPGFLLPFVRPYGGISWYLACLSPTSAASLMAAALLNWERVAAGVTLQTLWLPVTQGSSFCVGSVLLLLAADVLLFAALTWYSDKAMPTSYGQVLPPWFFLLPSYWRSRSSSSKHSSPKGRSSKHSLSAMPLLHNSCNGNVEHEQPDTSSSSSPYVDIVGLRRTFTNTDGSTRVAVEGLNMQMSAGRITALLGHNGAGKTTTIHMLTGMLQPTAGTAYIAGHDITTSMAAIRRSLGICPQFDILWPDISVREHLVLYAVIKGASWAEAGGVAEQAAAEVGLSDKLQSLAGELSGGQRRKLSVAIAFLGNPAVVFLDEPSSGMDPYSRRATWDVIRRRRHSSVIVLTTHSMEEADLLADDIHILAEGRLVASGSSLSLKAAYGVGYTLTAVMQKQQQGQPGLKHGAGSSASVASASSTGASPGGATLQHQRAHSYSSSSLAGLQQQQQLSAAAEGLLHLVQAHVPAAALLSAAGAEVSVRLPKDAAAAFPAALRALDAAAGELGVASYGLSVTTLEEVFLAIADQAVPLHMPAHANSSTTDAGSGRPSPVAGRSQSTPREGAAAAAASTDAADAGNGLVHGAALYWQQFGALFVKRMLSARRDRLAVITQLLVPLLLVLLAMAVSSLQTTTPQQPPLAFTRKHCLMGSPALLAAAPSVRQQVEFRGFMDGYPRSQIVDTQYTQLYSGSSGPPLNLTLEGQLLAQWDSGSPHYDAVYFHSMPPLDQLLTSLQGSPVITLLVNQSAVSGLPPALNQATTALLRVMVAAGGARKSRLGNTSSSAHPHNYSSQQAQFGAPGIASTMQKPADPAAAGGGGGHLPSCLPVIRVASSPMPLLAGEAAERVRQDAGALMLVLCMTMAASVLSASFVVFLVREQENNSKHLQMVSGAPPTAFWLSNFAWDLLNFSLPAAGILGLVAWYNQPQLAGPRLAALAVLLAAFSGAGLTLTYLCHSMFKDEMKALQRLNTAYFLSGYLGFTATWLLGLIARILGKQALAAATAQLKGLLRWLSPHYCFAQGLYDITSTYQGSGGLPVPGLQPRGPSNPFAFEVLGVAVLHLLGQTLLFGSAVLLLEVGLLQLLRPAWQRIAGGQRRQQQQHGGRHAAAAAGGGGSSAEAAAGAAGAARGHEREPLLQQAEEGRAGGAASQLDKQQLGAVDGAVDDDVAAERQAVEAAEDVDEALVLLDGITKSYQQGYGLPPVAAISGLWLRVWPGECFGLLGVNGAGKTTTFKVLTGEVAPDSGDAAIAGHSVLTALAAARRRLGYCPQFEALPAALTGREVLHMYAALRGVQGRARIAAMAQQLLQELGLSQYADTVCGAYSGGNKRKLSVAVALVGGPPLVLLDEPSTGMDPSARRFLWRVLQSQLLCGGRTILLTSHSMEEVEALAGRLAIMAGGAARCIGTPQHLKSKFGDGYTLELRISSGAAAAATAAGGGAAAGGGDGGRVVDEHTQSTTSAAGAGAMDGDGVGPPVGAGGLAAAAAATEVAEHHFMAVMPGAAVLEKEPGRLLLRLPLGSPAAISSSSTENTSGELSSSGVQGAAVVSSLADVFEAVEASRAALGITEYSLSQSSLERVFLSLAKAASCAADGE